MFVQPMYTYSQVSKQSIHPECVKLNNSSHILPEEITDACLIYPFLLEARNRIHTFRSVLSYCDRQTKQKYIDNIPTKDHSPLECQYVCVFDDGVKYANRN